MRAQTQHREEKKEQKSWKKKITKMSFLLCRSGGQSPLLDSPMRDGGQEKVRVVLLTPPFPLPPPNPHPHRSEIC